MESAIKMALQSRLVSKPGPRYSRFALQKVQVVADPTVPPTRSSGGAIITYYSKQKTTELN
jgi:hypothetical protein